jgi:predicted CXXCH cytochrome family protein
MGLGLVIGCATPEERYRTLSLFFDDVPLPESMRPAPVVEEDPLGKKLRPPVPKAPTLEWVVHEPKCEECHPSSRATQLPYASAPQLCWDCHRQEKFAGKFLHGPFAAGACQQCHSPHKSQHRSLLLDPPEEICEGCHDLTTFAALEQHRAEQGEDCLQCHSPHSAPEDYLLKAERPTAQARTPAQESGTGARP